MSEFKKVECTCSHGYTCRNMQDPNCCAHSCDYNDLVDALNAVQAERDALAAQVAALKNALSKCRFDSLNQSLSERAEIQATFELTPQHHLAAHDAEVAKAAFIAGVKKTGDGYNYEWCFHGAELEKEAEQYAAQLRAKAKP